MTGAWQQPWLLGLIAGITIFLGFPIARVKSKYIERVELSTPFIERDIDFDALEKIQHMAIAAQTNPLVEMSVKKIQTFEENAFAIGENENAEFTEESPRDFDYEETRF